MTSLFRNKLTLTISSGTKDGVAPVGALTYYDGAPGRDENQGTNDPALESLLIAALEQATNSSWRLVCASLAVEQCEPFRTCFLSKEVRNLLQLWHAWQNCNICEPRAGFDAPERIGNHNFCPQSLMIDVDLYRPLEFEIRKPLPL